ncbi:McrB family protein [Arenimonas sp.]|jgi:5-methylcytosine-specific restriction protein B|uniref:McrB family protein n=1 Tax=Arenimonas sp. TaxID=1872635 RepID=UPI0037BFF369
MTVSVEIVVAALLKHKNVLLYGPPGTGKSHLMSEVAKRFEQNASGSAATNIVIDTSEERAPFSVATVPTVATRWVTFHQGYSYEDFVLGMRPESSAGGLFSLIPRPGVLLELAAEARNGKGLLLIDEINRGNTSRIFGEFITLMEPEKRLGEDGAPIATTITITLPYLAPGERLIVSTSQGEEVIERAFAMPSELYTLASMNSVDKSIAPIDTALRRRFHVINLAPALDDLEYAVGLERGDSGNLVALGADASALDVARIAVVALSKVNKAIGLHLGVDFMLGQWYLKNFSQLDAANARNQLFDVWLYRVLPQLIELFHGRGDTLASILEVDGSRKNGSGLVLVMPSPDEIENGATQFVIMSDPLPTQEQLMKYLQKFAGVVEAPAAVPASPATPLLNEANPGVSSSPTGEG